MTWPKQNYRPLAVSILVSTNGRPSIFSKIFRHFPSGGEKEIAPRLHDPVGRTPRHVCGNFRAKDRRSDLPVSNMTQAESSEKIGSYTKNRDADELHE